MSLADDSHWREVPKDRTDPDYPPHLTERFCEIDQDGAVIIYEECADAENRWVQGVGYSLDSML